MGYSLSLLATRGKPHEEVLNDLGLLGTGDPAMLGKSAIAGAALRGGWYLVVAKRSGHRILRESGLKEVSRGCELVTLDVEEHVMFSAGSGWKDGRKVWSVTHDNHRDIEHLEIYGEPPAAFQAIREKLFAEQQAEGRNAEVDCIFDIPVELFEALNGFRHDETASAVVEKPFEVLETKGSWLTRIFGK